MSGLAQTIADIESDVGLALKDAKELQKDVEDLKNERGGMRDEISSRLSFIISHLEHAMTDLA